MRRQSSDGSCRPARHRWCRASGSPWPPTLDHRPNQVGRPTLRNHRRRPHQHRCTAPPDSKVYFQDAVAALRPCSRSPPRCRAVESHVRATPSPTHPLFPFCVALHFASVPPDAHDCTRLRPPAIYRPSALRSPRTLIPDSRWDARFRHGLLAATRNVAVVDQPTLTVCVCPDPA